MNPATSTSASDPRLEARAERLLDRLGSVPASPDGARAFLQRRVAFMFGLAGALWILTWVIDRVLCRILGSQFWEHGDQAETRHVAVHLGVGLALVLGALALRRVQLSQRALSAVEISATLGQIVLFCVMLEHAPLDLRPDLAMLLCSAHILVLRAALIPAGPRSAGVLGLLSGLVVGVFAYVIWRDAPAGMAWAGRVSVPIINTTIWSIVTIVGTSAVSFVIYGLRKRVERAMELGQYTLLEKLGEGGMGVVYRARHALLRRPTAVKVLRTPEALVPCTVLGRAGVLSRVCPPSASPAPDGAALARFEREVQLTAQISHPNVVSVYDFGRSPEGAFYYAMEFLDGVDLQRLVQDHGPLPPARVIHVLAQVAEALSEAHAVGLIHRDIKPANVILCDHARRHDLVKVVDFGLVKELSGPASGLSEARVVTGTPLYMAPESITRPSDVDARSDLYALGAVGYFLLTGEPVFEGKTVVEVCGAHLHKPVVPPSERTAAKVPASLEQLILQCLAKKRDERPASAEQVAAALHAMATAWTKDEARAWWADRHRGALERKAPEQSGMHTLTVAPRDGAALEDTLLADVSRG
jgi:serine/threonine-protein kinase